MKSYLSAKVWNVGVGVEGAANCFLDCVHGLCNSIYSIFRGVLFTFFAKQLSGYRVLFDIWLTKALHIMSS